MKKIQKKSSSWRRMYMRYRFWLICINYNFDFLVLYKMYFQNYFSRRSIILESFTSYFQEFHSRPCCIRYTNSRLRLEFVYLIQHGRSCCKYDLKKLTLAIVCDTLCKKGPSLAILCKTLSKLPPSKISAMHIEFTEANQRNVSELKQSLILVRGRARRDKKHS